MSAHRDPSRSAHDAVVVGAGIVGLMTALALAEDGRGVLVLDREGPGSGTSAGNAGILAFPEILPLASPGLLGQVPRWLLDPLGPLSVRPSYALRAAPWLLRFIRASGPDAFNRILSAQATLNRLAEPAMDAAIVRAGLGNHVSEAGTLDLYDGEDAFRRADADWARKRRAGIGFEVLRGRDAIEAVQPGLAERFHAAAVYSAAGRQVREPREFTQALARHLEGRGVVIRRARVEAIRPVSAGAEIVLGDGAPSIVAPFVVLAAGAWSKQLAQTLGDRVPLESERGYNVTLPPGAFPLRRQLYFNGHGFVATPIADGVRIGGAVEIGGLDLPPNFRRSDAMLRKAQAFMPGLRAEGGRAWMGHRPSMPDTLAVIGRSRASRRIVYAFGHGHLGLTQSAATGRLVADLAAERPPAIDLSPFSPQRF
ncbi:NAD(P)/FAD-dependent oxidoreductase [Aureimonas jatrophae]|uniref:NAD(P)/FAD-dependent oxidoreductase n=1 Tax=Aureimonas jatrophae TaxID=1166073 RepID=UPI00180902DB|nr:FAD-binding oxidoreductase [Aureimonas jatrophae]MBB3948816.1 D-amino-acid dehydrogenase [Aureimonas jatrophae]